MFCGNFGEKKLIKLLDEKDSISDNSIQFPEEPHRSKEEDILENNIFFLRSNQFIQTNLDMMMSESNRKLELFAYAFTA
jgi:hypothetical protein